MVYIILDKLLNKNRLFCIGLLNRVCVVFEIVVDIKNIISSMFMLRMCLILVFNMFYYSRLNIMCSVEKWMNVGFSNCYYLWFCDKMENGCINKCCVIGVNSLNNDSK